MRLHFTFALLLSAFLLAACTVPLQPVEVTPTPESTQETESENIATDDNIIEATFVCPDGTSIDTVFDNTADTVTVTLPDGTVTLPRVISGSGARYSDDTTTFWNKGDEALVEVDGEIVYQNCTTQN